MVPGMMWLLSKHQRGEVNKVRSQQITATFKIFICFCGCCLKADSQTERGRGGKTEKTSTCWFTPQMAALATARPGQRQGATSFLHVLHTGGRVQALGPSFTAFPSTLAGSQMRQSGIARTQTGVHTECWCYRRHFNSL